MKRVCPSQPPTAKRLNFFISFITSRATTMEKGSRLRARKRSLSGKASRRIASCAKCSKRFITFSGSNVCVDCRQTNNNNNNNNNNNGPVSSAVLPKSGEEQVNGLGNGKSPKGETIVCSAASSIAKENVENTSRRRADIGLPSSESAGTCSGSANDGNNGNGSSNANDLGLQQHYQKQEEDVPLCNEQTEADEDGSRVADRTIPTKEDPLSPPQATTSAEPQVASYNEICDRSEDIDGDNRGGDDEDKRDYGDDDDSRTGDNDNNDGSNADDNHDEDGHSSGEDVQVINDSGPGDEDKKKDHDDDVNLYDEEDVADASKPTTRRDVSSVTNNLDHPDIDRKSQHASSSLFFATSNRGADNASYRCFICNADLSAVQGLKGRMNHIKRCGKKHGIQAGDGAKGLHGDQMGESLIEDGQCTERVNIGRQGWHDDQDAGMAIDDVTVTTEPDQEPTDLATNHDEKETGVHSKDEDVSTMPQQKQSSLNSFFTRPIRSLDKVLLQGARNVAKKEHIASKRRQLPASNAKSNGGGRGGGSWKRRKRESPTSSPAYKRISNTTVLVDAFHYANPALPQTHFLSHFHSDHYGGITKHWNAGVIYCSLPTASLVHSQLGVPKKYLHPLPMHTKTVVDANGRAISVTLLDANHCPGAVMFLFELSNGKQILHVGDFRWDRDAMLGQLQLRQFWQEGSNGMRLDDIYLDTTYCNEKYATMPSQKEAIAAAVSTARNEIEGPPAKSLALLPNSTPRRNPTLLLFGSYTIGKEKIFMSCAQSLKMKIYVEPRKLRILSALDLNREQMGIITTVKSEAQIWVVPMGHCSFQHMDAYLADANSSAKGLGGGYSRVVAFRPTGWTHGGGGKKAKGLITTRRSGNKVIHGVPYSEHSSFSELVDCLLCLKPKRIIPTVSVSSSQEQVERLLQAANEKEMRGHY